MFAELAPKFAAVAAFHLLAVASPGPDFALILKYGLSGTRRQGLAAAWGIAAGIVVHIFYCVAGIALLLMQSPGLFRAVQLGGALYLVWIGVSCLREVGALKSMEEEPTLAANSLNDQEAFRSGFITNVLNPKATLFFLSLFTQFFDVGTPLSFKLLCGAEMVLATGLWFSFMAWILGNPRLRRRVRRIQHRVTFILGVGLCLLGLKVAVAALNLGRV